MGAMGANLERKDDYMQHSFWHQKWEDQQIGFHQEEINPMLQTWASQVFGPIDATNFRVLVPLCGKSADLVWLNEQGWDVWGNELSPVAVEEFGTDNEFGCSQQPIGDLRRFTFCTEPELSVWLGDWFGVGVLDVFAGTTRIYDRAALVAMPPEMRIQYANRLNEIAAPGCRMLLISREHDFGSGPPFTVDQANIEALYPDWQVELLETVDCTERAQAMRDRGATVVRDTVYSLVKG